MSHFGDFMDGVPVKISEKYKRPPRIELPYSVIECPNRAQNVIESLIYCSTFERNVLSKLKELRSAKETKRNERRHRLQLLEEAQQKKLDAIAAAEAEERLKQLSVSEVSYPSTDEISGMSSDEKLDKHSETSPVDKSTPHAGKATTIEAFDRNVQESQQNILQPVQVKASCHQSLLDDPDPLQELKKNAKIGIIPQYNHNVDRLTFRDFEQDTSSPFDNVELKTINDMELLAQVLQKESTAQYPVQGMYIPNENCPGYTNCATQVQLEGGTYLPNSYMEQTIQGFSSTFPSPQNLDGYYIAPDNTCDNIPVDNIYLPNYQYCVPTQQVSPQDFFCSGPLPLPELGGEVSQINYDSTFIPQPYYYQYPHVPVPYTNSNDYNQAEINDKGEEYVRSSGSLNIIKSRSRSVPDIVKELNEELALAKIRASERSCNASPAPKATVGLVTGQSQQSYSEKKKERKRRKSDQLPNPYDKLPNPLQIMCQKIHGMGFPLDRVARICNLVGDNDKKIIEGLLILGELMDLGFSESKVSAALARHEFNRDKALDELVS